MINNRTPALLTFDIEEFYHGAYPNYDYSMVDKSLTHVCALTERICQKLVSTKTTATFFMLGETAREHPQLVPMIVETGSEVASHSYSHSLIYQMDAHTFEHELLKAKQLLEKQSGKRVIGFRAPNFSIDPQRTPWAFETLSRCGFEYDSSIFPARALYGGSIHESRFIGKILGIDEYPMSCFATPFGKIPFAGGFYFRLLPLSIITFGMRTYFSKSIPPIIYLHPKDLDAFSPKLPIGFWGNVAHRGFTTHSWHKFESLLQSASFTSIANYRINTGICSQITL